MRRSADRRSVPVRRVAGDSIVEEKLLYWQGKRQQDTELE